VYQIPQLFLLIHASRLWANATKYVHHRIGSYRNLLVFVQNADANWFLLPSKPSVNRCWKYDEECRLQRCAQFYHLVTRPFDGCTKCTCESDTINLPQDRCQLYIDQCKQLSCSPFYHLETRPYDGCTKCTCKSDRNPRPCDERINGCRQLCPFNYRLVPRWNGACTVCTCKMNPPIVAPNCMQYQELCQQNCGAGYYLAYDRLQTGCFSCSCRPNN